MAQRRNAVPCRREETPEQRAYERKRRRTLHGSRSQVPHRFNKAGFGELLRRPGNCLPGESGGTASALCEWLAEPRTLLLQQEGLRKCIVDVGESLSHFPVESDPAELRADADCNG